jgi:hypothetical protein
MWCYREGPPGKTKPNLAKSSERVNSRDKRGTVRGLLFHESAE